MDAFHAIKHSLAAMGYDPNEFAIESNERVGGELHYEASSPSRGMSVTAIITKESGNWRVTADVETTAHSYKRNVSL